MDEPAPGRELRGSCHCGNIRFALDWPGTGPIPVRACGCTFCQKHRGVWTSHPDGRFRLWIGDEAQLTRYRFATKSADFHVCATCGVAPIVTCMIDGADYAVINVWTLDDIDRSQFVETATNFDAEATEGRLDRRRRTWTPRAAS